MCARCTVSGVTAATCLRLASVVASSGRNATSGKNIPTSALSVERKRSTSRWKMSHTTA